MEEDGRRGKTNNELGMPGLLKIEPTDEKARYPGGTKYLSSQCVPCFRSAAHAGFVRHWRTEGARHEGPMESGFGGCDHLRACVPGLPKVDAPNLSRLTKQYSCVAAVAATAMIEP